MVAKGITLGSHINMRVTVVSTRVAVKNLKAINIVHLVESNGTCSLVGIIKQIIIFFRRLIN